MPFPPSSPTDFITELYLGYYNRPPDNVGLQFWLGAYNTAIAGGVDPTTELIALANDFANSVESTAIYPYLASPNPANAASFVTQVYANVLNRAPDALGLAFWVNQLTTGKTTTGAFIVTVEASVNLQTGTADAITLAAKIAVAEDYVARTTAAGVPYTHASAATVMAPVSGLGNSPVTSAEVTAAEALTTQYISPTQTFTLTIGRDSAITGQAFDGTGAIVSSNDVINAPLAGASGTQNTLSFGDTIELTGLNNSLNTFFAGNLSVGALTVQGVQTFSYTQATAGSFVQLLGAGGPTAFFGPDTVGGANGLQTINVQNGVTGALQIGNAGGGIKSLLTGAAAAPAINVENNPGTSVLVFESAALFTGTATLFVATNSAASSGGGGTLFNVGSDTGSGGYKNWVVQDQDNTTDTIILGQQGSNSAASLTVTGAFGGASGASVTLYADGGAGQWAGLTTLDGSLVSGKFTVTGNEIGAGGLLDNNNAINSITGGSGGSVFDLTSLGTATADAVKVNGGSGLGEVAFTNAVMTQGLLGTPIALTNIAIVDDASGAPGGTINMANFPLVIGSSVDTAELQFVSASGGTSGFALGSNLAINNGATDFGVQFNEMNFGASVNSISITAGLANINGGNDVAKVGLSDVGSPTIFSVSNYTTTDLLLPTNGHTIFNSSDVLFSDTPVAGANGAALNIYDNGSGTPDALLLGNVNNASLDVAKVGVATAGINAATNTTITDFGHGLFVIGGTNVNNLNAQSTSELIMDAPATGGGVNTGFEFTGSSAGSAGISGTPFFENSILNYGITVNGSMSGADLLQGVSGLLTTGLANDAFIGAVGSSSITGSNVGGDNIFPEGGNTTITLGAGHGASDTVWFGFYDLGAFVGGAPNTIVDQAITDVHNGGEIGVNAYLGALSNVTTINNFKIGAGGDVIKFSPNDWVGTSGSVALATGGSDFGLWNAGIIDSVVPGASALKLVTAPTTPITTAVSITLDGISTYTGAAQLQSQLKLASVGDLDFGGGVNVLGAHNIIHELVAYQVTGTNNINIADVELLNTTASAQSGDTANPNLVVSVHDLIHLVGVGLLSNLNAANFAFHA